MIEHLAVGSRKPEWLRRGERCAYHQSQVKRAQKSYKLKVKHQLNLIAIGLMDESELDLSPVSYPWTD